MRRKKENNKLAEKRAHSVSNMFSNVGKSKEVETSVLNIG